ncbi:hypothetical protein [Niallia sp. MER TA 168]|uniref:hypothetical protein n=1 Tax=Niallia sp. MER TA 168 TaxID=2939568 RepID=UPI00203C3DF1|nr:hypothetical protein [Niallia sp. MER TA 168]MCM3364114.1 hypothetical protein [Niallia sp. MER TA 168]
MGKSQEKLSSSQVRYGSARKVAELASKSGKVASKVAGLASKSGKVARKQAKPASKQANLTTKIQRI